MSANDLHKLAGTYNQNKMVYPGSVNSILYDPEIDSAINRWKPNETPFLTILNGGFGTSGIRSKPTSQLEFNSISEYPLPEAVVASAAATSSGTTLTVVDAGGLTKRHVLLNTRTQERVIVKDVYGYPGSSLTAGQVTIARAIGSAGVAIVAGDTFAIIGTAMEEGQEAMKGITRDVMTSKYYCQEFGWATGITEYAQLSKYVYGGEWNRIETDALDYFKQLQEKAALLGAPSVNAAGSGVGVNDQRLYTTAGVEWFCRNSGNVFDFNHGLSVASLEAAIRQTGAYSTNRNFLMICSEEVAARISMLPEMFNKVQFAGTQEKLGFNLKTLQFLSGTVKFLPHRMLNVSGLEGLILIVNLSDLMKRPFRGDKVRGNVQLPGQHTREDEYTTIWGLDCTNPIGCGLGVNAI